MPCVQVRRGQHITPRSLFAEEARRRRQTPLRINPESNPQIVDPPLESWYNMGALELLFYHNLNNWGERCETRECPAGPPYRASIIAQN